MVDFASATSDLILSAATQIHLVEQVLFQGLQARKRNREAISIRCSYTLETNGRVGGEQQVPERRITSQNEKMETT